MKKIIAVLLAVMMVISMGMPVRAEDAPAPPGLPPFDFNFEVVHENAYATMLLDPSINNIRVVLRACGTYFDTLVPNGVEGSAFMRNMQRSDFHVNILRDEFSGVNFLMSSYVDSVQRGQVTHTMLPDGVQVHFLLGDPSAMELDMFPFEISPERMYEFVTQHMTDAERTRFTNNLYGLIGERYVRRFMPGSLVSLPMLRQMYAAFYEYGTYTFEELAYDNAYWEHEQFVPSPLVEMIVEYILCGPDLIISIPRSGMVFDDNNPFVSITPNPYFLSGSVHDRGYIFVPDGSGGIIHFNNQMVEEILMLPVFGDDPLNDAFMYRESFMQATLPIYGVVRNNTAILAIIEEGAAAATINANVSGRIDEFNRVFPVFDMVYMEAPLLRGAGIIRSANVLVAVYDMDIRQRFIFLTGEDATYVGMAQAYQRYLLNNNLLRSNPMPQDAPFFVNMIASAPRQQMFLGVPYTHHFPTTSTRDAQNILQSLTDAGIRNIHAQYSYWTNGGMLAGDIYRLRPLRSVGGRSGMRELNDFAEGLGVELYPAVRTNTFTETPSRFFGIRPNMLSRGINNMMAWSVTRDIMDRSMRWGFAMLSPNHWLRYQLRIARNFISNGFSNIASVDIGSILFGNYGRRYTITRPEALTYAIEALEALSGDLNVLLHNPNAYAFPFVRAVTNVPFQSGGRRIIDYPIPFKQMVLANHVPFAMPAYNDNPMQWQGFTEYMLRAVESRSGLHLTLTRECETEFITSFLHFPQVNNVFNQTRFSRWEHRIGDYYARFNEFYRAVHGAHITAHQVFEQGRHVVVTYSNNIRVYINYGNNPWEVNGRVIAPLDFKVVTV